MSNFSLDVGLSQTEDLIHGGHFGAVLLTAILLLGISWMKNPNKNRPPLFLAL